MSEEIMHRPNTIIVAQSIDYGQRVAVIIPAFNAEDTITKAIKSIPDSANIRIIVVDDCSTDNTLGLACRALNSFAHSRCSLVTHAINKGVAAAVNSGLKVADDKLCEYVVLLGADDDFYTEEFEKAMEYLDGTDLVYFDLRTNDGTIFHLDENTKEVFCGSTKFMRRKFIGDLRNDETKKAGEDWYFYQELLKKNPTEKFTNLVVKHYNFPREGSLSWKMRNGQI